MRMLLGGMRGIGLDPRQVAAAAGLEPDRDDGHCRRQLSESA
ncbi:MAG: hypothetical protein OXT09_29805 [Myxococcales bacterium]|nr:hypothetical protein [Myxococcales bacterium]